MPSELMSVSPVDGRYHAKTASLSAYFSEYALFKYRVHTEVEYLIALSKTIPQLKDMTDEHRTALRSLIEKFSEEDAARCKEIERTTNHDLKAVEYWIKEQLPKMQPVVKEEWAEFIHFGLTSQDANNTAIPLMLKDAISKVMLPTYDALVQTIKGLAEEWKHVPMLARTHGQPATPTTVGKELMVFVERLNNQLTQLRAIPNSAKFGGATGNFNAHHVAFPNIKWIEFANDFVNNVLGLNRSQFTTQIEHYDNLGAICDAIKRINTILIDFSRDMWMYISMHYFKQKIKAGEVGSSTMPHKVNPIDYENAEGNLGIANALLEHFAAKLPISRMQRDLTDSTVLRNLGVPLGHILVSITSLNKGIGKLMINEEQIKKDLGDNWEVCAEAIQTILRREAFPKPYEALKELTRVNTKVTQETLHQWIDTLNISDAVKTELKAITPFNYLGPGLF
eukprot:TRINITY_DN66904_c0_g1_i1.p1 TRINITY_DN66904_c0_g1~~TRINITY_DN66904_c0_g1_i1.p1  ORF type:complete len:452 (-),score=48.92 TRINITY_DN66904_c0_g1_i1:233-1588(-)